MPDALPSNRGPRVLGEDAEAQELTDMEIVNLLHAYASEAEEAREGGPNPRDETWRSNWDRYWGRYDMTDKADWQSKHIMPEVPQLVDRWAAAMREALDSGGEWFDVQDQGGQDSVLIPHVKKVMAALLARCARTPDGHTADFSSVFEDQMKMGAIMACCASVTWRDDMADGGWVAVETVDPREVWYDPKGRGLYRRRSYEVDRYELLAMAQEEDADGESLYDTMVIEMLAEAEGRWERENRERATGSGEGHGNKARRPIKIDEWLCNLLDDEGRLVEEGALVVVANDRFLIRGPETNPFDHGKDWIVFTPMVSVPMSVYGRSYMEDWSDVADAFVELTQLILDGVFTSTIRAYVANPQMLEDPTQLTEGIAPNKIFQTAEEIRDVRTFMHALQLGQLPAEAITVWRALKEEMREGAKLSEIALGQMAPRSRTTATEIMEVRQSGSAMIRSMARTIEARFLEPVLTLVWKTALQHMDFLDLADEIGEATANMLNSRRQEFLERKVGFRVRGISGIVDRQMRLQNLLSALSTMASDENLLQAFLQRADAGKIVEKLFELFGVDPSELEMTPEELLRQQLTQPPPDGSDLV